MDGFMCRLCVNLTYRQTKAVLVIYPYFTASQFVCCAVEGGLLLVHMFITTCLLGGHRRRREETAMICIH
jgi:hypothetical protein